MNSDPVKQAWLATVEIAGPPSLVDVRRSADKFYRRIRLRNTIEYVSCAVVIAACVYYLFTLPHVLHKIGSVLLIAAAIYAPWQLHRRASAVTPEMAGTMPIYVFLRGQLVRQRDALRSIFGWYMAPFFPGIAAMIVANGLDPKINAEGPPIWMRWLGLGTIAAAFALIWWLNQLSARRLQRRIDEIDGLLGDRG